MIVECLLLEEIQFLSKGFPIIIIIIIIISCEFFSPALAGALSWESK